MIWKRYQNELIVLSALFVLFFAYVYKYTNTQAQVTGATKSQQAVHEFKEAVALKKIWADKNIDKKVATLKTIVPSSKVTWKKEKQKATASYKGLNASELNTLTGKILNIPVEISLLNIDKIGKDYNVELTCKW